MNFLGNGIDGIKLQESLTLGQKVEVSTFKSINISNIRLGKYQPRNRNYISDETLEELAFSIKEHGILQPIIVKQFDAESYEIIAGERRYLAALRTNISEIPAIVQDIDEEEAYAMAIIENLQRDQLTLLEQAEALQRYKKNNAISIEEIAKNISKPRSTVSNLIRVASMASVEVKKMCEAGLIEFGHIRAVLSLNHDIQEIILHYVIDNKLSVRRTEHLVATGKYQEITNLTLKEKQEAPSSLIESYTNKLIAHFSCPVKIRQLDKGKIRIQLDFDDLDQISNYLDHIKNI